MKHFFLFIFSSAVVVLQKERNNKRYITINRPTNVATDAAVIRDQPTNLPTHHHVSCDDAVNNSYLLKKKKQMIFQQQQRGKDGIPRR